jgi:hypothetical protein
LIELISRIGGKGVFVVMALIVIAVVVDNSVVGIATSTGGMRSSASDITLFALMVSIFVGGQYVILRFVGTRYLQRKEETKSTIRLIHKVIIFVQYALAVILVSVILQMTILSSYHIYSLVTAIFICYGSSCVVLTLLALRFFSWYRSKRNLVVLLYGSAISLISLNAVITIIFLTVGYTDNPLFIRSVRSLTGSFANPTVTLSYIFAVTSILSFIVMWTATVFLLKHYSRRLGKIKYWIIVIIPLVYFISQFQSLFLFTFAEFRMSDPVSFGIFYTLIFSANKPLGGVLFGIAFWTVSRNLKDEKVKGYLIVSAYGMTLLFTANQPATLNLVPYPPFGLVTICFLPLASYLLFLGIYSSAVSVSQDSILRKTIRNATYRESQGFLDIIGTAEMERLIEKRVLEISELSRLELDEQSGISSSLDDDDARYYVREVLEEIVKSKKA